MQYERRIDRFGNHRFPSSAMPGPSMSLLPSVSVRNYRIRAISVRNYRIKAISVCDYRIRRISGCVWKKKNGMKNFVFMDEIEHNKEMVVVIIEEEVMED
ncbi:hypothetical protein L195_g047413 [Trifolium pratense]|uniref:Uncharacterized protein n=1 Tax=Trifolium pratense TaxID=57577 RepID=A0A2K3MKB8_TRIPR|nr:hypothetical protein L195_g047413 [Trifolium pratense]